MASRIFPGKLLFLFLFLSSISAQENFFVPCGKIVSLNSELLNSLSSSCNYISPRTQQLKEILKTDFSTYDTCSILLNSILETGLYCEGVTQYSHFIKDSLIVKVLISFLRSDEQEIRNMAADFMTAYANPAHLNFYSYYIRENCQIDSLLAGKTTSASILKILCLAKLNDKEKQTILEKNYLPVEVRARLGDTTALNSIINNFKTAPNVFTKRQFAFYLGYVGGSECALALTEALDKQMLLESANDIISIRYYLIGALSRIHPDNSLLSIELERAKKSQAQMRGVRVNNQIPYVSKVKKWAEKTYNIKLETDTTDLFL